MDFADEKAWADSTTTEQIGWEGPSLTSIRATGLFIPNPEITRS